MDTIVVRVVRWYGLTIHRDSRIMDAVVGSGGEVDKGILFWFFYTR